MFVSYSFSNKRVTEFKRTLEVRGFRPTVVDDKTLLGAPSLRKAISQLIRQADYVVPLMDQAAAESEWVKEELALAVEHEVPLIPVMEEGVEPSGSFADVPSLLGVNADALADRVLRDYVCLNFDPSYPVHFEADAAMEYVQTDKPALLDMDQKLSSGIAAVLRQILDVGHEGLSSQATSDWRRLQVALDELQEILPSYRAALSGFLKGWEEPERRAVDSFNALTRMIVGKQLMSFIETWSPESHEAWHELRAGVTQMQSEWKQVEEEDPLEHHLLWGLGKRQLPFEEWWKDKDSPVGNWVRVEAQLYTGEKYMMILPDREIIASGLRLGEPPRVYLESWDWLDFILPQLAYRRVELSADLGSRMLVALKPN